MKELKQKKIKGSLSEEERERKWVCWRGKRNVSKKYESRTDVGERITSEKKEECWKRRKEEVK